MSKQLLLNFDVELQVRKFAMTQNIKIGEQHISQKIASLSGQEPQPAGITKWATTLRFGKILGTISVVRSIQNPRNVVRCKIHRP